MKNSTSAAGSPKGFWVYRVLLIFSLLGVLLFIADYIAICMGLIRAIILAIWCIWLIRKIQKIRMNPSECSPASIIAKALVILGIILLLGASGFGFSSHSTWKYRNQIQFLKNEFTEDSFSYFPQSLPDSVENYKLEVMPSIMQGTGYTRLHFSTQSDFVAQCESELQKQAQYTLPFSAFSQGEHFLDGDREKTITLAYTREFWEDASDDAIVYVLYTNLNWNHPKVDAVIIDRSTGKIEFGKM